MVMAFQDYKILGADSGSAWTISSRRWSGRRSGAASRTDLLPRLAARPGLPSCPSCSPCSGEVPRGKGAVPCPYYLPASPQRRRRDAVEAVLGPDAQAGLFNSLLAPSASSRRSGSGPEPGHVRHRTSPGLGGRRATAASSTWPPCKASPTRCTRRRTWAARACSPSANASPSYPTATADPDQPGRRDHRGVQDHGAGPGRHRRRPDYATHTIGLEIWYNAFVAHQFGYATAAAWLMGSLLIRG